MDPTPDRPRARRSPQCLILAATTILTLLFATTALGQESHANDSSDHHHKNHVAVFAGGMTPLSAKSETSFALGADYIRRFSPEWGIGVGADFTFGDHKRTSLFALGLTFNATPALRLATGPGFELVDKPQTSGGTKTTAYFVWFVSGYYGFHVGSLSLGPMVIVDFVGETKTNVTYGISAGTGF